ncbi:hypothetical protein MJO55_09715 [Mycolicibacterium rufum]|uniref:Uncharacterized protein n=1 Tax=Mycolicibacterium rufum TaxID=318424 RepID=A0A9X2YI56_9MYCO|nr:hypothetical protein [Mycolicibacterium rufum]KGI67681.1 hypothetical protein EU78_09795 [Mycolicibacterium rufum]MCV7073954.1 hypothetical protein [Mycolicibacterium rufum]ULP38656.1 hypothetical protein MJO55_09715 [Mycolicibacterium rufum]
MGQRVLLTALAAAATALGAALLPAADPASVTAQQPWDPGCWGPFAWGSGDCDWSPSMGGSTTNGPWDPSVTGPGQFNRAGTGSGSNS